MVEQSFQVIIEKDEDGVFVASVPSLPGCHTQGKTFEEVRKRAKQAISLYSCSDSLQRRNFLGLTEKNSAGY